MHKRTKSREAALQALYQIDVNSDSGASNGGGESCGVGELTEVEREEALEVASKGMKLSAAAREECSEIFSGALDNIIEIDGLIVEFSKNWTLSRMTLVDRNILRLSAYELVFCPDIPYKVVIDEAIELARRFGAEDSGAFINGILDKLARSRRAADMKTKAGSN